MSQLIAMVATAVLVNGERTVIEPGQPLPDLSKHDKKELLDSGSALDPEAQATTEKALKNEEALALRGFQEARKRVEDEQASTAADAETSDKSDEPTSAATTMTAKAPVAAGKKKE